MHIRPAAIIAFALLLTSCALESSPEKPRTEPVATTSSIAASAASSSSSSSSEERLEFADAVVSSEAMEPATVEITERLTDADILEIGAENTPILAVFTNYGCDYCQEFAQEYLPQLEQEFLAKGKLRIATVIVPLTKYPNSAFEASALLCAAKQGKGRMMHEALTDATSRTRAGILALAKTLELNATTFQQCLDDPATAQRLSEQQEIIRGLNIALIPTFVLYEQSADNRAPLFVQGKTVTGLPTYADLRGMIEEAL